jgi:hypothetical protein
MFKSLLLPGWGQLSLGRERSAKTFFAIETAGWVSVIAFLWGGRMIADDARIMSRAYSGLQPDFALTDGAMDVLESYYSRTDHLDELRREARDLYPEDLDRQKDFTESQDLGLDWGWESDEHWTEFIDTRQRSRSVRRRAVGFTGILVFNRIVSGLLAARQANADINARTERNTIEPFLTLSPSNPADATLNWGFRVRFR